MLFLIGKSLWSGSAVQFSDMGSLEPVFQMPEIFLISTNTQDELDTTPDVKSC